MSMAVRARPPSEVLAYATALTDELQHVPGAEVFAAYLHGSAALGGWRAHVSDVDVLVVVAADVDAPPAGALADAALATIPACPGAGLELSVVTRSEAASPRAPWRFVVHVAGLGTAPPTIVHGEGHAGDPDLLLHYAVCREAGWPLAGPPAVDVVGPVLRSGVLEALAAELLWGLEHAAAPYALLNACRALVYLREGRLVAKITGGRWAIDRGVGPSDGICRALDAQTGSGPAADLTAIDIDFVKDTARRLMTRPTGGVG